jgi:hypothetical protein
MTAKRTAPRRKAPVYESFTIAMLTGRPLPADERLSAFRASFLTRIDERGLLDSPDYRVPFTQLWEQYHCHAITAQERASVVARAPEIEAALTASRARFAPPVAVHAPTVEEGSDL